MPAGTGGFCVVPGSHKANFEVPFEDLNEFAEPLSVEAGDVILFTEAHPRLAMGRVLIYKYCPGYMAWISERWDESTRARLTPLQRQLTVPPYVFNSVAGRKRSPIGELPG